MRRLRKILAMVMICVIAMSVIGINAMANEEQWTTVELDGTKKVVEIEWNLEQDMWHWFEITNKGEDKIKFAVIGTKDQVLPEGVASPGIGMGIGSKGGSEPLLAGKYTIKLESLGTSNLKGVFRYKFSTIEPTGDVKTMFVGEAEPMQIEIKKDNIIRESPNIIVISDSDLQSVSILQNYGIIEGDLNGDMRPYSFITRAEFAKVICKMLNIEPSSSSLTTFNDVGNNDWYYGYVIAAYENGIIEGCDNGNFEPNREVTFEEALKMIVSAMGYMPKAEQMGGYPQGYAMVANQLGITEGIDHALALQVKRYIVFEMCCNAMDVPFMLQSGFGANMDYIIADGKNGTQYITFRSKITGNTEKPAVYDKEYIDELNKFAEGGEYYDEIAAELEEFWKPNGFNGTYTFEIVYAELNSDATQISLKVKITPDNGEVCYLHLGYAKVDGEWKF